MTPAKTRRPTMPITLSTATPRIAPPAAASAPAVVRPSRNAGRTAREVPSPITNALAVVIPPNSALLASVGPEAPTLGAGWTAYDLAAHLAVRDRVPAAWPGIALSRFAGQADRVREQFKADHPFGEVVALVRRGAPAWSPMGAPVL